MSDGEVRYERRDGIGWITLDRSEARNSMTFAMYERLAALCRAANDDPALQAVVLTGAGDAFVAGTDIAQFVDLRTAADAIAYERKMDAVFSAIEQVRTPTIAAIRGPAVGGGVALAASCDLRICSPSARFGVPVARTLGNCFAAANLVRVSALIGQARLTELVFTARLIDAAEAKAAGLVSEVVADEAALLPRAEALARQLATHAPLTLRATKEALRRVRERMRPADAEDLVVMCYTSEDFREGVRAFLEKRKPVWTGR